MSPTVSAIKTTTWSFFYQNKTAFLLPVIKGLSSFFGKKNKVT